MFDHVWRPSWQHRNSAGCLFLPESWSVEYWSLYRNIIPYMVICCLSLSIMLVHDNYSLCITWKRIPRILTWSVESTGSFPNRHRATVASRWTSRFFRAPNSKGTLRILHWRNLQTWLLIWVNDTHQCLIFRYGVLSIHNRPIMNISQGNTENNMYKLNLSGIDIWHV